MTMYISHDDIRALHRKYAASDEVFGLIYTHCEIVRDIAVDLAETSGLPLDRDLVIQGAMLHDIGVYALFAADSTLKSGVQYIQHGVEGEAILKNEGLPEEIWRFASHHTGVGLTKHDVVSQQLPLPVQDYTAATNEELLVMYADKFHSKTTPPVFNSYDSYRAQLAKFGTDKPGKLDAMAEKFGKPNLDKYREVYGFEIK